MAIVNTKEGRFQVESWTDEIDVTMLSRPDTSWQFTDPAGHLHRWHVGRKVATSYSPRLHYHVPNLKRIVDVPATDEYPAVVHYECRKCRAHVSPGHTSDTHRQTVPGIQHMRFLIDGQPVTRDEFMLRAKEAGLLPEQQSH